MVERGESRVDLLSGLLGDYLDELDRENESEDTEVNLVVHKMIRIATASLEGFTDSLGKKILDLLRDHPSTWRWSVDDYFTRQQLAAVPGMVGRFLDLRDVLAGRIPGKDVSTNLSEAARCYIQGFFQASVALSRTALEGGLDEFLSGGPRIPLNCDLVEKINWGERVGLLPRDIAQRAHSVRVSAREVLHRKHVADKRKTLETLVNARSVLKFLYRR